MRPRRMYREKDQWVLGQCLECGHLNYVEPHGVTAQCMGKGCREANRLPADYEEEYGIRRPYTDHTWIPSSCTDDQRIWCIKQPNKP